MEDDFDPGLELRILFKLAQVSIKLLKGDVGGEANPVRLDEVFKRGLVLSKQIALNLNGIFEYLMRCGPWLAH